MEFPNVGDNCSVTNCNSLDFLPVRCTYCNKMFCNFHFSPLSHNCEKVPDRVVEATKIGVSYSCSEFTCNTYSPLELICHGCKLHYCTEHRHHGCSDAPRSSKSAQAAALRREFREIKEETDKQIQERLKTAKNRELANKIKLMKMKGNAFGDNHIPTSDRLFFSIAPPLLGREKSNARSLFFSKDWTLGRMIDSAAKRLKVDNKNDRPDAPQLTFFNAEGQMLLSRLDAELHTLVDEGHISNGDSLILEYIPTGDESSNESEQSDSTDGEPHISQGSLSKYIFSM